jgi:hypothetical protein
MIMGEIVNLQHVQNATNRTKNRIRENGPDFIVLSKAQSVRFDGGLWIRLESIVRRASDGKGGKEPWSGWLPAKEVFSISRKQ